jgi:hypothetical protein
MVWVWSTYCGYYSSIGWSSLGLPVVCNIDEMSIVLWAPSFCGVLARSSLILCSVEENLSLLYMWENPYLWSIMKELPLHYVWSIEKNFPFVWRTVGWRKSIIRSSIMKKLPRYLEHNEETSSLFKAYWKTPSWGEYLKKLPYCVEYYEKTRTLYEVLWRNSLLMRSIGKHFLHCCYCCACEISH